MHPHPIYYFRTVPELYIVLVATPPVRLYSRKMQGIMLLLLAVDEVGFEPTPACPEVNFLWLFLLTTRPYMEMGNPHGSFKASTAVLLLGAT
jgi:hypothetical protein